MESEHFVYIFQESLSERMPAFVKNCEDAYSVLTPVFHWAPKGKTIAMYFDSIDVHNGWATVFPRPTMAILAADSPPGTTTYEPGNYTRRTVFHEFSHILTMDSQYGVDAVLSTVLGRGAPFVGDPLSLALFFLSLPPGAAGPAWYQEGLAMWAETEFVGPGRGRNTRVDMMFRAAAAEDRMLPGNLWSLDHPEWPYGNAAYIYGLKTIEHIHDTASTEQENVPGELADSVARSFMFKFNNRSRSATGEDFSELAEDALKAEKKRQDVRIKTLEALPFTRLPRLTPRTMTVAAPKFGPDGRTIYLAGMQEAGRDVLFRYSVSSGELRRLHSTRTGSPSYTELATSPDHRTIYYTRLNVQDRESVRNELHGMDTLSGRSRVVTRSGRYRYPAVWGDTLAAAINRAGKQALVTVPIARAGDRSAEKRIVEAPGLDSIVNPAFSPDGESLVYVRSNEDRSQIRRVNLATGEDELVFSQSCTILSPVFHPSGQHLVFVSDANGVFNLYKLPMTEPHEPVALTHTLGGVFQPDFSVDGGQLAVVGYDSYGYYLAILEYGEVRPVSGAFPVLKQDWRELARNRRNREQVAKTPPPDLEPSRKYWSIAGMRFDGWTPWLTASEDGAVGGLAAAISDPTEYQRLFLLGGVESEYGTPLTDVMYQYSGFYPVFTLYGQSDMDVYTDILRSDRDVYYDYVEETTSGGAALTLPWNRADWQGALTLGVSYSDRGLIADSADDYRGKTIAQSNQFEGAEASLWGQAALFTGTAYSRSHSVEDGRYVTVSAAYSDRSAGGDLSRTRVRADWFEYISLPYADNHVVRLEGVYARATGDKTLQGSFGLGQGSGSPIDVPGFDRSVGLRGYGPNWQVGDEVMKAGIAYRLPLFRLYRGAGTTAPFYMHQIFGEVFYEGGRANGTDPVTRKEYEWIGSAGAELNFGMTVCRFLRLSPGLGVVYAFDYDDRDSDDRENEERKLQVYLTLKGVVNF